MRLGIDFGTTRTVVAASDRGNYPVVSFVDAQRRRTRVLPVGRRGTRRRAPLRLRRARCRDRRRDTGALVQARARVAPRHGGHGDRGRRAAACRCSTCSRAFSRTCSARSSTARTSREGRTTARSPPSSRSRRTRTARSAGSRSTRSAAPAYAVRALLNEPSAAGFEYTHRQRKTLTAKRDARRRLRPRRRHVRRLARPRRWRHVTTCSATAGSNRLGGDDFDEVLVDLVLARAGSRALTPRRAPACSTRAATPRNASRQHSKRVVLDVGEQRGRWSPSPTSTSVQRRSWSGPSTPCVRCSRTLGEDRRARRASPASTSSAAAAACHWSRACCASASGAASTARRTRRRPARSASPSRPTSDSGFAVHDRLSRTFGVFREKDEGRALSFDALLLPDVPLGGAPLVRRYRAAHNVGHFRFVECACAARRRARRRRRPVCRRALRVRRAPPRPRSQRGSGGPPRRRPRDRGALPGRRRTA